MTNPLSTRAARLLEIQQNIADDVYRDCEDVPWLLAELTAAEAERDRLKAELEKTKCPE